MVTAQSMQRAHSPTGNADLHCLWFILFMDDLEGTGTIQRKRVTRECPLHVNHFGTIGARFWPQGDG
jgi:hypothetical protein